MRTVISLPDEAMVSYGFPIAWYTPSLATSLAYEVALGPLLVDLIVYFAACGAILFLVSVSWMGRTACALLWLAGVGSAGALALVLLLDPHFVAWTLDGYFGAGATRSRSMYFGLGARI